MASKACIHRLQREYKKLLKDPVPHIKAHPSPSSLLRWYFVFEGAKDTDFEHGVYLGRIDFATEYPYKPPSMMMLTPSGRFVTEHKLCLSNSDYHPESWNPMWSVASILTGLMSVMHDTSREASYAAGSMSSSRQERQRLASQSLAHNLKNSLFLKLFPEYQEEFDRRCQQAQQDKDAGAKEASAAEQSDLFKTISGIMVLGLLGVIAAVLLIPLLRQDGIGPNGRPR